MSDDPTVPPGDRAPNAAAAAARRARRIGGAARSTSPEPASPEAASPEAAPTEGTEATGTTKVTQDAPAEVAAPAEAEPTTAGLDPVEPAEPDPADPVEPDPADPVEPDATGEPAAATPRRVRAIPTWIPAVLAVAGALVMAALLAISLTGFSWHSPNGSSRRDQVLAAAKACVAATNTYDYTQLDAFEKKGLACSTGALAVQFKQTVDKVLRKDAAQVKQKQTFQVNTAGIISVSSDDHWQLLIYGQVQVTNTSAPSGRTDPYGAIAEMVQVHGQWRMDSLGTVCSLTLVSNGSKCV